MRVPLVAAAAVVAIAGCGRTSSRPVVSPDGSMEVVPDTTGELALVVSRTDGPVLYRWETGASPCQWWVVEWKNNETLTMASGDIGAYILERRPDGTWRESTPGGVFSPDGAWMVQTSWDSAATRKLHVWFGEVTGRRSYHVHGEFRTDLVVADPFDCARWDGNSRVIVRTTDGERAWRKTPEGVWGREE